MRPWILTCLLLCVLVAKAKAQRGSRSLDSKVILSRLANELERKLRYSDFCDDIYRAKGVRAVKISTISRHLGTYYYTDSINYKDGWISSKYQSRRSSRLGDTIYQSWNYHYGDNIVHKKGVDDSTRYVFSDSLIREKIETYGREYYFYDSNGRLSLVLERLNDKEQIDTIWVISYEAKHNKRSRIQELSIIIQPYDTLRRDHEFKRIVLNNKGYVLRRWDKQNNYIRETNVTYRYSRNRIKREKADYTHRSDDEIFRPGERSYNEYRYKRGELISIITNSIVRGKTFKRCEWFKNGLTVKEVTCSDTDEKTYLELQYEYYY